MNISCPECKSRFRIPDEKASKLEGVTLTCPKCGGRVSVDTVKKNKKAPVVPDPNEADSYDASKKPFDFLEPGSRTAIVCIADTSVKQSVLKGITEMGYHVTEARDSREALRNMWYHTYHLVLLDELFDTQNPDHNRVLIYLEGLNMAMRREMIVVLLSRSLRTMDEMGAFQKSVNLIINIKNLMELSRILQMAIREYQTFYQVYKDLEKKETAL